MRSLLFRFTFCLLALCAGKTWAQDTLVLVDETIIECKVVEVKLNSIDYKKFGSGSSDIYNINKALVQYIIYNTGVIDTINYSEQTNADESDSTSGDSTESNSSKKGFEQGYLDGYDDYGDREVKTCSGLAGGFCGIWGIIVPISYSLSKMRPNQVHTPNFVNNTDPDYRRGYLEGARKRRNQMAWRGYGTGVGISLGIGILIAIAINV